MADLSRRNLLQTSALFGLGMPLAATSISANATPSHWDKKADIVVAGGGCAGCMAALTAAKNGKKVLLVQAMPILGGSSAVSSGWIRSCMTKWHEKKNVKDSAAAYAQNIIEYGAGTRDADKAKRIAALSTEFVNYLISIGVKFTDDEDRVNGGKELRIVKTAGGGAALMEKLSEAVLSNPSITVMLQTKLTDVILDEKREKVVGVKICKKNKNLTIQTSAVVIATGGFGRNQNIVQKFTNEWAKTGRVMDQGHLGEGLVIAANLGAGVANLDIAMICPTLEVTQNIFFSSAPLIKGGIFVNENGQRFVNEYIIYTTTPRAMLQQKETWEIVTPEMHPAVVGKMIELGVATKCNTLEDLAKIIGCDVRNLKADIEDFNRTTRKPADQRKDKFGRTVFGIEIKAPYYILKVKPVMIETVGGFTIDSQARITTLFGVPIAKGLFGAGAAAFGEHFGRGYRSGEAYCYAGTTGMMAGASAAKVVD